jgi:branched-chain amino acid transport system ATP-binding protein
LLDETDVGLSFAGVRALDGVSLRVAPGELCAVIGPNGAGKTSLFNCISGFYRPQSGTVRFAGESLMGVAPHAIAARGVARMFQNLALFTHLTVLENLQLGRHQRYRSRLWHDLFFTRRARAEETGHRHAVERVIDFLDLERYRKMPVGILPYGVLKRVELGRALCMDPLLLLLDEPAAGLNQEATEDMARYVLDIKEELGITQVLIEHDLRFVLDLADRVCVLDFGRKLAEGRPDEIKDHPAVLEAYTGFTGAGAAEAGR